MIWKTITALVSSALFFVSVAQAQPLIGTKAVVPAGCMSADNPKEVAELLSQHKPKEAHEAAQDGLRANECGEVGLPGELTEIVANYGEFYVVKFTISFVDKDGNQKKIDIFTVARVNRTDA